MAYVLVIDDEPSIRETLAVILRDEGYEVELAPNLAKARGRLADPTPLDVILTGLALPDGDGLTLLDEVNRDRPAVKVVLLTSNATVATATAALRKGAVDYIEKPATPATILRAVNNARELGRLERENAEQRAQLEQQISERTAQLQRSERRYRALAEGSPVAIFEDEEGVFTYVNNKLVELIGADGVDELLGSPVLDLIYPDDLPKVQARVAAWERGEIPPSPYEVRVRHRDGGPRWVELRVQQAAEGQFIGTAADIAERKRLQRVQRLEAIGQLAGGVAHDFNNILTAIHSYAELIAADLEDNDGQRQQDLREIREATERGRWLTSQLLAFSRQQVIQPRPLRLDVHVQRSAKLLRRLLGRSIVLAQSFETKLWLVKVDPGQLDQILINLAANARDAMPEGGKLSIETSNVTLDARQAEERSGASAGQWVRLRVRDTGEGMTAHTREHLFEPFFSTKEKVQGTGLGLATVFGVISQCDGFIEVESAPGDGACFDIFFPRCHEPIPRDERPGPQRVRAVGGERVLLAEDDPRVRRATGRILRRAGYEVVEAADGFEAIERAAEQLPDVLISDIVMPQMEGGPLLAELRSRAEGLPALFISGYAEEVLAHRITLDQTTRFLHKPFSAQELLEQLRELLDGE